MRSDGRIVLLALLFGGCAPTPYAEVRLALSNIPEEVSTVTVWVVDVQRDVVVTSATSASSLLDFSLGVARRKRRSLLGPAPQTAPTFEDGSPRRWTE